MPTNVEVAIFELNQKPIMVRMPMPSPLSPDYPAMAKEPMVGVRIVGDCADSGVTVPLQTLMFLLQKLMAEQQARATLEGPHPAALQ